jgi:hypothetical protein
MPSNARGQGTAALDPLRPDGKNPQAAPGTASDLETLSVRCVVTEYEGSSGTSAHIVILKVCVRPDQSAGIAGPAVAGNGHDGGLMAVVTGVNEGSPGEPMDPVLTQVDPAEEKLLQEESAEGEVAETELAVAGTETAEPEAGTAEAGTAEAEAGGETEVRGEAEAGGEAKPARDMSPLAVLGIIFGVIALVGVAAGVVAMVTHGFHRKTVVTYRPAAVFGLRPGDCVNSGASGLAFTLLSCAKPHEAEVFATFALTGSSWPGDATARQDAGNGCADRLAGYLKPQLVNAGFAQEFVYPDQSAWQAGERTVVCEVSSPSGPLTGSVRNTG